MSDGEIILYSTEDGQAEIQFRVVDGTVWLSQMEIAELFDTSKQNISLHMRNILADGELDHESTVKEYLTVQTEGKRQVEREERRRYAEEIRQAADHGGVARPSGFGHRLQR